MTSHRWSSSPGAIKSPVWTVVELYTSVEEAMKVARHAMIGFVWGCLWSFSAPTEAAEPSDPLAAIGRVTADGSGNSAAARSWAALVKWDASQLPRILTALDGAAPLAANWLRSAVDAIPERTLADGQSLPVVALEKFALDTRHDPRGRRLAFEWLARVDPTARDRLIPGLLMDPGVEFRRDAVARLLGEAAALIEAGRTAPAAAVYRKALGGARDNDQISLIVEKLQSVGERVDLPRHFGFLMKWNVMGPFDNTGRKGFVRVYAPERELKHQATYAGKDGEVRWLPYATSDPYGMVDINQPLGKLKQTVAYTWTEFYSEGPRQVELRLGCKNAWKVWVNGDLLFGRNEYHRGIRLDQYRMQATLKPGVNHILVKVCQNEQTESWTVEWQFQLRVCDATGTAILSASPPEKP